MMLLRRFSVLGLVLVRGCGLRMSRGLWIRLMGLSRLIIFVVGWGRVLGGIVRGVCGRRIRGRVACGKNWGKKNVSFPHIFAMEGKAAVMKIVEDTLN